MNINDTPDFADLEKIQAKKEVLETSATKMGLYLEDWSPLVFEDPDNGETRGMAFGATFLIGDLALKDREAEEEETQLDAELEAMESEFKVSAAIEAYEKLQKLMDDDES